MVGNEPIILDCPQGHSPPLPMGGGNEADLARSDFVGGRICVGNVNRGTERGLQTLSHLKSAKEGRIDELENGKVTQS